MSSLFTDAEVALADLAIGQLNGAETEPPKELSVMVGGLGLGYTAVAALRHPTVGSVTVIEALDPVIEWHRRHLLPISQELVEDHRTQLVCADFFAMVAAGADSAYDAVLLDIDHAPDFVLHESHHGFYTEEGLRRMREFIAPGGVFGLWSDNPPEAPFADRLRAVFAAVDIEVVSFTNPLTRGTSANTVYLAFG